MTKRITSQTRRKLKTIAVIGVVGLVLGPLFANLAFGFASYRIVKGMIVGEIGDSRKGIVFHGDVMNTVSRIQAQCNAMNQTLLVSKELMHNVAMPGDYRVEEIGRIKLKGKQNEVELFAVHHDVNGEGLS